MANKNRTQSLDSKETAGQGRQLTNSTKKNMFTWPLSPAIGKVASKQREHQGLMDLQATQRLRGDEKQR